MIESLSVAESVRMVSKFATLRESPKGDGTFIYRVYSPEIHNYQLKASGGADAGNSVPGWTTKHHETPEEAWHEAVEILANQTEQE